MPKTKQGTSSLLSRFAPSLRDVACELGDLVERKNAAYGSSVEKATEILHVLYPEGIAPEKMGNALLTVRVADKLARLAAVPEAFGESPWSDIAGYGICGTWIAQKAKLKRESCHAD